MNPFAWAAIGQAGTAYVEAKQRLEDRKQEKERQQLLNQGLEADIAAKNQAAIVAAETAARAKLEDLTRQWKPVIDEGAFWYDTALTREVANDPEGYAAAMAKSQAAFDRLPPELKAPFAAEPSPYTGLPKSSQQQWGETLEAMKKAGVTPSEEAIGALATEQPAIKTWLEQPGAPRRLTQPPASVQAVQERARLSKPERMRETLDTLAKWGFKAIEQQGDPREIARSLATMSTKMGDLDLSEEDWFQYIGTLKPWTKTEEEKQKTSEYEAKTRRMTAEERIAAREEAHEFKKTQFTWRKYMDQKELSLAVQAMGIKRSELKLQQRESTMAEAYKLAQLGLESYREVEKARTYVGDARMWAATMESKAAETAPKNKNAKKAYTDAAKAYTDIANKLEAHLSNISAKPFVAPTDLVPDLPNLPAGALPPMPVLPAGALPPMLNQSGGPIVTPFGLPGAGVSKADATRWVMEKLRKAKLPGATAKDKNIADQIMKAKAKPFEYTDEQIYAIGRTSKR